MLVCLTPMRNAAADVEAFLSSVTRFTDAVIVLDDGSDDATRELLEHDGRVTRLLCNPVRHDHSAWDDAANRQRLLDSAAELEPDWLIYLDADERIDEDDGAALRTFLEADALPGCAYGLQLFREWEGEGVEAMPTYVYRLFAHRQGLQLPAERLHLNPVPVSIPRPLWVNTTIRVRHLDSAERIERRRRKYAEADPGGEWERGLGPRLEPPIDLVPWPPRDRALPVLVSGSAVERASLPVADREPATLACLLPIRDEEDHVEGFLECAGLFADRVLVLDDGSTDGTAERLAAHELVEIVARNPPRDSYAGWDDAANRQLLLDAALERGFDWVFFLDADERLDPEDAEALRTFVEGGASPEHAYGFRRFRMIEDGSGYDEAGLWVYRLFSPREGDELPSDRLHLIPVPESRQQSEWRRTTIRIQHLAGLTPQLRRRRYQKYEEADPDRDWQDSYDSLLTETGEPRPWKPRPAGFPVLADPLDRGSGAELDLTMIDLDAPVLSVVCIAQDDAATIEESVAAIVGQKCDFPFETIVVTSGSDATASVVRDRFPQVKVVELPGRVLPGAARNAGLAVARGDYVSFPGSHVILTPGSLQARVRAHERGYAMVSGRMLNGTDTPAGWASYFMENPTTLPGAPSRPMRSPPIRCSYQRELLVEIGGFPEHVRAGEDTAVNQELWGHGHDCYSEAELITVHRSPCRTARTLVTHHFQRGRALAQILRGELGRNGWRPPAQRVRFAMLYVPRRLRTIRRGVRLGDESVAERHADPRVRLLLVAGVLAAWSGLLAGLVRSPANGAR